MIECSKALFVVGEENLFDACSPENSYCVLFEDDLTTGYFYAVDQDNDMEVLDALHIYNVEDVVDRCTQSEIKIFWSGNGLVSFLVINDYCHAVFDFESKAGYCRNGLPDNKSGWILVNKRILTDQLLADFIAIDSTL